MQHCSKHIKELELRHNHFAANIEQTDTGCCLLLHNVADLAAQSHDQI